MRAVWLPGVGAALSSVGFGAIVAFGALLFAEREWSPICLPFCAFAAALIAARLVSGDLVDRLGGARAAMVCIVIQAAGLGLISWADGPEVATAGAALAGLGYALVYPGLGAVAMRRFPPESRGWGMGTFTVFLDIALGLSGPALGALGAHAGLGSVFLWGAVIVASGSMVSAVLIAQPHDGA